ncbi:hypothetical protein ACO0LB_19490 [Undibacterium sp. SXout7W]|uniref:hypothetical protein n=1 Tax=Undibacterium sp. SXout7W TaxID=3413049 RepID=UPI003BF31D14
MARKDKYPTPPTEDVHSPERSEQLARIVNDALNRFSGSADELEKAVGMMMLGDYLGWKALLIIHNKRTLRKYEEILGINVREFFPEEGLIAKRLLGYDIALKLGSFWKVVSGDVSVENRRDMTNPEGELKN